MFSRRRMSSSSSQRLREETVRRMAAVSHDICSAFEYIVDEYKAELARQRRLLDVVWNPDIQLHVSDLSVLCKDEPLPEPRREPDPKPCPEPGPENLEDSHVSDDVQELADHQQPGNRPGDAGGGKIYAECQVCGKTFKLKFHLKRHLRSHDNHKPVSHLEEPLANPAGGRQGDKA